MNTMAWRDLVLDPGILSEPTSDGNRLIVWLRGARADGFQYWERITSAARADMTIDDDLCVAAATSVPARQSNKGVVGSFLQRFVQPKGARVLNLPNGEAVQQCGERRADVILVWRQGGSQILEPLTLQSRWPEGETFRRLGQNLFVVTGVDVRPMKTSTAPAAPAASTPTCPRAAAERMLADARQIGDRKREAVALTDLAVITLNEGNARRAITLLEEALAITRQLGDRARESDVLGNLGMAALAVNQLAWAKGMFEQELNYARSIQDHLAAKINLERAGLTAGRMGDHAGAVALFEEALTLARMVRDRQQEANLLWYQGIHHAELGERNLAIARAEEAITLFKLMGKPQAAWYGAHLQKYRMGQAMDQPRGLASGQGSLISSHEHMGGSTIAQVMGSAATDEAARGATGPGLLRMALSATKAMANFVGSGFKTAAPEIQRKRIETCAGCEHHTGLRCRVCGCFTHVKSGMLHEDCPIGKWPA